MILRASWSGPCIIISNPQGIATIIIFCARRHGDWIGSADGRDVSSQSVAECNEHKNRSEWNQRAGKQTGMRGWAGLPMPSIIA
jgi:hypothetical protein